MSQTRKRFLSRNLSCSDSQTKDPICCRGKIASGGMKIFVKNIFCFQFTIIFNSQHMFHGWANEETHWEHPSSANVSVTTSPCFRNGCWRPWVKGEVSEKYCVYWVLYWLCFFHFFSSKLRPLTEQINCGKCWTWQNYLSKGFLWPLVCSCLRKHSPERRPGAGSSWRS